MNDGLIVVEWLNVVKFKTFDKRKYFNDFW
jgi:hypothetical protein